MTHNLKHCPICNLDLAVDDFGICRRRKDGRNLYCKSCIRQKVTTFRRKLKEMKKDRKRVIIQTGIIERKPWVIAKRTPSDRVLDVLRKGPRTYYEIVKEARLHSDTVGDILAKVIPAQVVTRCAGETRYYFLRTDAKHARRVA